MNSSNLIPQSKKFWKKWLKNYSSPERSHIVKQIFEKIAYDGYKWRDIYKWLKEDLWFKTRTWSNLALSWVYRMINDTFDYREFEYPKESWSFYKWDYEPIITKELFELVQNQLNFSVRYKEKNKVFTFTRIMKYWNYSWWFSLKKSSKNWQVEKF